jgi:hypothetical protein
MQRCSQKTYQAQPTYSLWRHGRNEAGKGEVFPTGNEQGKPDVDAPGATALAVNVSFCAYRDILRRRAILVAFGVEADINS